MVLNAEMSGSDTDSKSGICQECSKRKQAKEAGTPFLDDLVHWHNDSDETKNQNTSFFWYACNFCEIL